jgi:hypothetical protein
MKWNGQTYVSALSDVELFDELFGLSDGGWSLDFD